MIDSNQYREESGLSGVSTLALCISDGLGYGEPGSILRGEVVLPKPHQLFMGACKLRF